jgi:glycosyltransferase involved in cell wall biosynthesis
MKIALFHELIQGGARRLAEEQAEFLAKNNSVDVFYVDLKQDKQLKTKGVKYYFNKFLPQELEGQTPLKRIYKDTIELVRLYFFHKKIAKIINNNRYDLVIVHPSKMTQAPFILRFLKAPVVYYCEEPLRIVYDPLFKVEKSLPIHKKIYENINRIIRKQIDLSNFNKAVLVLANSNYSKAWIENSYKAKNVKTCYPGVNSNKFKNENVQKEFDLLFLGNDYIEGDDLLKETLAMFRVRPKVKQIIRDHSGVGVSDKDLIAAYNKAKIVLCLARSEPLGLTPLEAMSCQVPVIAVAEGGHKETVIDGVTGYLIKRDANALFDKIKIVLSDDDLAKKIGKSGRESILRNWSWDKNIKFLEKLLQNIIVNLD